MKDRLGEMLLRENAIDPDQLEQARDFQKNNGGTVYGALVKLDYMSEDDLVEFLVKKLGLPNIYLEQIDVDLDALKLIPAGIAQKYLAVPYGRLNSTLQVAMADPTDLNGIDDIHFMTGLAVEISIATESEIRKALDTYYDTGEAVEDMLDEFGEDDLEAIGAEMSELDVSDVAKMAEEAPVVKLVNWLFREAIQKGVSDIHVEPYEKVFRIRFRIDGSLYEFYKPPIRLKAPVVSRLKIMSRLDIAERRLPQDGRIKLKLGKGRDIDLRVSVLPTLFGEKVVMRLLDKSSLQLDMTKLGFEEGPLRHFKEAIHKPFGMVLVTGPTGSGKTTTLYSAMSELNTLDVNISTCEDPVEFNLPGINQVQMHEEIGLTFASSLRSFLRQDPDIIMVGEIRDFETAEIGVKAALTGHLVLSTLHTNDAPQTVNRLLNMGVEPFLVASSVNLILAQRLARKVCPQCKTEIDPPVEALRDLGVKMEDIGSFPVYEGKGCGLCANTGFKGRLALYEVMPMMDEIRELVLAGASAMEIKREAVRLGMDTLRMAGINKLKEGITTVNEVARTTMAD
jgi:type IV pilus assembly protein PilB